MDPSTQQTLPATVPSVVPGTTPTVTPVPAPATVSTIAPGTVVESTPTAVSGGSGYETIPWSSINLENLVAGKVEPKTYETKGKDDAGREIVDRGTYYDIPILYCNGDPITTKPEHFYIEGPPLVSYGGITGKLMGTKMVYSLKLSFKQPGAKPDDEPIYTADSAKFKELLANIWLKTGKFIQDNGTTVKLPHFRADSEATLLMCGYKNKVYTPKHDFTGEPLNEKSTMFVKLLNWQSSKDGSSDRTAFVDADGQTIEWPKLQRNLRITLIPLLYIKKVYVSSKASIQIMLKSAIVLAVAPIKSKMPQMSTILKLKSAFPDMGNALRNELAALEDEGDDGNDGNNEGPMGGTSNDTEGGTMDSISGGAKPPISTDASI